MKYDAYNKILTIDSLDFCTEECFSSWIDQHIEDVLMSDPVRSYRTNRLEISIAVVCSGYVVAVYNIKDGSPDEFWIQSVGYNNALASV